MKWLLNVHKHTPNLDEQSICSLPHICWAWALGFNLNEEMVLDKCGCMVGLAFLCFCHYCKKTVFWACVAGPRRIRNSLGLKL